MSAKERQLWYEISSLHELRLHTFLLSHTNNIILCAFQELHTYSNEIEDWDDVITIAADFSPLQLDTMTKDMQEKTVGEGG